MVSLTMGYSLSPMGSFELHRTATPVSDTDREKALSDPGFGRYFTDHMAVARYDVTHGWHGQALVPTAEFRLHPASAVLHYGQEIFEGLKAYRREDNSVWLFRPERNATRFRKSAQRLSMPELPEEVFLDSLHELVTLEQAWVPEGVGEQSLYLRPFMIADEPLLGVREAFNYTYAVIATPAGPYYPDPVKLWVTPNFTRAAAGGTGAAKCGGNYAASLAAANEAHEHGCEQVLYTDGAEHTWIEESGTMNFMALFANGELVTPALGSILEGVTRDSILALAPKHGLTPVERRFSITELFDGLDSGAITEVFCCGTAAVITPIIGFNTSDRGEIMVADGRPGTTTRELRSHLLDIQYGRAEDPFDWTVRVV